MKDKLEKTTNVDRVKKQYAIYDRARKAFLTMMEKINDRCALRDFEKLTNNEQCMISQAPEDYAMYFIGDFNEETGEFTNDIKKLAEAVDYKEGYTPKVKNIVQPTKGGKIVPKKQTANN